MLYLSLYFKTRREEYYAHLQNVRENGDWEGWLQFFLTGVLETAQQAVTAAQTILRLFDSDRRRIATLGQQSHSTLRVHDIIQKRPIMSVSSMRKVLDTEGMGLSEPTVYSAVGHLEKLGILREITGKDRHRLYRYDAYMEILDEGTKPIAP
jgi:Fic family protein